MKTVYILGYSRSGTTLTEAMLTERGYGVGLGEVKYAYERGLQKREPCSCGKLIDKCAIWRTFSNATLHMSHSEIEKTALLIDKWESTKMLVPNLITEKTRKGSLSLRRYQASQTQLEHSFANADVTQYIDGSKMPSRLFWMTRRINKRDIIVLFVTRDPRGVAWSFQRRVHRFGQSGELMPRFRFYPAVLKWVLNTATCLAVLKFTGCDNIHVRYEDLVEHPDQVMTRLKIFLEDHNVTNNTTLFHSISGNPSRFSRTFRKIKPDYEWIDTLSCFKKITAWIICSPFAVFLGYPINPSYPPTKK